MTMKAKEDSQQQVHVTLQPARDAIARVGGCVHVQVTVEPPPQQPVPERKPVALALVIDRSGSMGSPAALGIDPTAAPGGGDDSGMPDKMSFVKQACLRLLELLRDGDLVSVVTFDDQVQVVKPMMRIDAKSRPILSQAILDIVIGGSTYLEGGIRAGYGQFNAAIRAAHNCKLILLSDGEANVGEQQPAVLGERAAGAAHNRIVTSALGVGFDYNIGLMTHLAEVGNGDFTHVEDLQQLDAQLREELAGAAEVTARAVTVKVEVPEEVSVGSNLNGYPQTTDTSGFKVNLGDLVRAKSFIFELTTPVELTGTALKVATEVTYQDADGTEGSATASVELKVLSPEQIPDLPPDADVVKRVATMIAAKGTGDSLALYDSGDRSAAVENAEAFQGMIDRAAAAYGDAAALTAGVADLKAQLSAMSAEMTAGLMDRRTAKQSYMQAESTKRSRPPRQP
jgi:Ca-activated chloride channel family protein